MHLTFLGSGDAFGSGGRFHTCFLLEVAARRYLLDCGASSLVALRQRDVPPESIDAVVLTHFHGDHFGGLPFLLLEGQFISKRTRPLVIAGPAGVEARVTELMEAMFRGATPGVRRFPIRYVELPAAEEVAVGELRVTAVPVDHGREASAHGVRIEAGGAVLAYSGDTAWCDALPWLAAGADLFVCECSLFDRPATGHLDYRTLRARRDELDCRRLILTHLGADVLGRRAELEFECARDGLVVEL
jgi:ribonuclease BN (tRNA processing enzyme)